MTVAECISLNSIANVVFFDNIISQSSATRSAMRQACAFYCENKWRYEPDGCRISDLRWSCPLKQRVFMATDCFLGCFWSVIRSVYAMSITCGKMLETLRKTMNIVVHYRENHEYRCSLQGLEPEISRIPKWVFYHYRIRIVATVCYTWNTNEVQSVTNVKRNVGV
jgi:hypothetical protein